MSELTEETAKELIAAISRLADNIKPPPLKPRIKPTKEEELAAFKIKHDKHWRRKVIMRNARERLTEEQSGTAKGSNRDYLNNACEEEKRHYEMLRRKAGKR